MLPWEEHLEAVKEYEEMLGDGNPAGMATLVLHLAPDLIVPVTHSRLVEDFVLQDGKSSTSFVEKATFRLGDIPQASFYQVKKGLLCDLVISPTTPPFKMQLWHGGLKPGGQIFQFMLVSALYRG
jgi:hypothetical protein